MNVDLTAFFEDLRVAVTGAAGTVGEELICQLATYPLREVRALDNNESALFFLGEAYSEDSRVQTFLADVRDPEKMRRMFDGIDLVFHAAAFKHVPLCERSPFDAVQTNIIGVQNVIQAALANRVKKVLFTSSDKAVNPTNVMGTSKLMGERLMTAANALRQKGHGPVFASTRFGNVAGSRGSVIPLFCQQIAKGGPLTLTDPEMTRFVMSLEHAVRLVIWSMFLARGGEVFITKMPVLRVKDMAEVMLTILSPLFAKKPEEIDIIEIGARPGEKLYEELMNNEETRRSFDSEDLFIILPAFRNIYAEIDYTYQGLAMEPVPMAYNSSNAPFMTKEEIEKFLLQPGVLSENLRTELHKKRRGDR
jgi:FlaA1/EpsC-like NDP-sugar epimerase